MDFTVALRLEDDNVSRVQYSYSRRTRDLDDILELYVEHVPFNLIGENLRITLAGSEMEEIESIEEANERLVEAIVANQRVQLIFTRDIVTANGDEARMNFSFFKDPLSTGEVLAVQIITFGLPFGLR